MNTPLKDMVVLVVLYNKKISESTTIQTLMLNGLRNATLIIHNNGPESVVLTDEISVLSIKNNLVVKVENCISNKPLGYLYNDFISAHKEFEKFAIFDDDTEVTDIYMKVLLEENYDIELPKIIAKVDNDVYYPLSNSKVVREDCFLNVEGTYTIGSGLIFTRKFIEKFNSQGLSLFDENYALYGVDFSLFRRMQMLNKRGVFFKIRTSSELLHSLSRTESIESEFRRNERIIDNVLTAKLYPSFQGYSYLFKQVVKELMLLNFNNIKMICSTFYNGKHPRCKGWRG